VGGRRDLILRIFSIIAFVFLTLLPASLRAEGMVHVTTFNFVQEVTESKVPVLVQFDAKWCPYCRALQPHLDRLIEQGASGMKVVKVDTDEDPLLTERFNITSLPTLIVMHKGGEFARHEGAIKEDRLFSWVASAASVIRSVQ
jgi:thioredoxin